MRIQHNIMAMNSYRNLSGNNNSLSKNLEKLSSGYRINRAGDDAAGLAISEKMRAQISGLDQAQKNAQSGINLVKTAEGALTEVHDMLNRMVTLASQSANGTYTDTDREKLQAEVDALTAEIDRIAENSNFNGAKLLDGSLGAATTAKDITSWTDAALTAENAAVEGSEGVAGEFAFDLSQLEVTNSSTNVQTVTFTIGDKAVAVTIAAGKSLKGADLANAINTKLAMGSTAATINNGSASKFKAEVDGSKLVFKMEAAPATTANNDAVSAFELGITPAAADMSSNQGHSFAAVDVVQAEVKSDMEYASSQATLNVADNTTVQIGDEKYLFAVGKNSTVTAKDGYTLIDLKDVETGDTDFTEQALAALVDAAKGHKEVIVSTDGAKLYVTEKDGKIDHDTDLDAGLEFKTGYIKTGTYTEQETAATGSALVLQIGADAVETIDVEVESMKADALGIADLDIGDVTSANAAIDTIKAAIEKVSVQRGDLGAIQNRLEHTINNLGVMEENIQDAEANIRDTDIADEMMAYTKNNILIQSAQAMLAQANQVPQGVLQLMG